MQSGSTFGIHYFQNSKADEKDNVTRTVTRWAIFNLSALLEYFTH